MTIDDAILYFKTEKPKQPRSIEAWDRRDAYNMAIEALKEKKERERRCNYQL